MSKWVPDPAAVDINGMEHLGGVPWYQAPLPQRLHRCAAQTRGWRGLTLVERCACGATSFDGGVWVNKNERRRE